MTRRTLADMEPLINAQSRDILGHAIDYKPSGRPWSKLVVQGNYEDGSQASGFSAAIEQQIELMALKSDMRAAPNKSDRARVSRMPGKLFFPVNVQSDETGYHWLFNLKEVSS